MSEQIEFRVDGRVAQIVINRPEKKNALSVAMYAALVDALRRADAERAVRVVLIRGSESCFTAGNDLQDFMQSPPSGESSPTVQFLKTIHAVKKPVVAAVAGPAVGIGTTLLLHCDLIYADPKARFQLPFVNLGLCPEAGSSYLLPQLVGHQRAAELLLFGESFTAETALEIGLVNEIAPEGQVLATAEAKARLLAERPLASLVLTKSMLKRAHARRVDETIVEELSHFGARLASPEAAEAFQAFFEKRKPDFSRFD